MRSQHAMQCDAKSLVSFYGCFASTKMTKLCAVITLRLGLQTLQITELLSIIEQQGSHLEQYRAVLDAQRQSNTSLNADCERIQAR